MGKRRNNANDGWHPQDDDRYDDDRYTHDTTYNDDYEYEDYEIRPRRSRSSVQRSQPASTDDEYAVPSRTGKRGKASPQRPRRVQRVAPPRRRRAWGTFFLGCFSGIFLTIAIIVTLVLLGIATIQHSGPLTNLPITLLNRSYTQSASQQVALSQLAQLTICDQVGNISVKVSATAAQATVSTQKTVQATSQDNANTQFQQMQVEVQPPKTITQPLTCVQKPATGTSTSSAANSLIINVTNPQPVNDSVNLTLTVPAAAIQSSQPSLLLNIGAKEGNVQVDGLSGVLNISNVTGNIDVQHAILADGSQLQTDQGNVSFNGFLFMPASGSQQNARYLMNSETGDIHVTLPASTNLTLDANTNIGSIKSDFPIAVSNTNGSNSGPANYNGPLNPSSTSTLSPATLVLDVSTGNVYITKAQSSTGN